jgi:hypothetical protein
LILYIEVFFVLINGALMLLAFKEEGGTPSAKQAMAYMARLQADNKPKADNIPKVDMKPAADMKVAVKKKPVAQKKAALSK